MITLSTKKVPMARSEHPCGVGIRHAGLGAAALILSACATAPDWISASGASREQVDASVKLMQAIQAQSSGQPSRNDDRLTLGDLTIVAISMGENRMAAATSGMSGGVPSVEAAIRLPPGQHPVVTQDDRAVRRKIDTLAEKVAKMVKQLKNEQGVRGGFDM